MDPNENKSGAGDPVADLGNLANELNSYDPTAELQAMAAESSAAAATAAASVAPITEAVAKDPTLNPAALAAPTIGEPAPMAAPTPAADGLAPTPVADGLAPAPAADGLAPADGLASADGLAPTIGEPAPAGDAPVLTPSADFSAESIGVAGVATQPAVGVAAQPVGVAAQPAGVAAQPAAPSPLDEVGSIAPAPDGGNFGEAQPMGGPITPQVADPTPEAPAGAEGEAPADSVLTDEERKQKVKAAPPLPGSIGSAKSYADIQKAEQERQAKAAAAAAAKKNGKGGLNLGGLKNLSTTTIILIVTIAIVAIIGIIVLVVSITNSNSQTKSTSSSSSSSSSSQVEEVETETMICKSDMAPSDYLGMRGVIGAQRFNTFIFKDGNLNSIKVEQVYQTDSVASALANKEGYDAGHPEANLGDAMDEPDDEDETGTASIQIEGTRYELEQVYTHTNESTYTYMRMVTSDHIEEWVSSEWYDPTEFGIRVPTGADKTDYLTLDDFKTGHNKLKFACSVTNEDVGD